MNEIQQLQADLAWAASGGSEQAGHAAVQRGVHHTESPPRTVLNIEHVQAHFTGALSAQVTATQEAGITAAGPILPDTAHTADLMAETATWVAQRAVMGKR